MDLEVCIIPPSDGITVSHILWNYRHLLQHSLWNTGMYYYTHNGITVMYYNPMMDYSINELMELQASFTIHHMEDSHVLFPTQWNYSHALPRVRWNYSITQFLELQASIRTHHMENRHVLLPTQWNCRHVLPPIRWN